ncbi:thiolase family protein [Miniphocaeibacter massiliensis]|uniref:thiolase family protein n=1 Tax=Miniphocaeibacter massiliensis TaxID=2041841 RepID=UPI001A90F5E1|nr:thiolase family protein [Miniphocaeibacter massiliensis]
MNNKENIVIVGAARTAVGAYLGELTTVPVEDLGQTALEGAIERAGINKEDIEEVIVGHVTGSQATNNLGRIIGINTGLRNESTGFTVNRICGSGLQSAISAAHELLLMERSFIAAGGAESLSRAEYYLPTKVRWSGLKMGDIKMIDSNDEGHRTASGKPNKDITHMGITAENIVEKYNISRESQDQFAYDSQMKAKNAMESGRLAQEIVPVEIKDRKGNITIVDKDGHLRPNTTLEALAKLRPVFKPENGTITAGNASGLNDGGAFEIFTKESIAKDRGLDIMARMVDYTITGCDPRLMGLGPVEAIKQLLHRNNLAMSDIDIIEINEAFSGQVLGCLDKDNLNIPMGSELYSRLNPNGGAVALGHPLGMSGARIITTICYEFKNKPEKRYAIASACIGGGQGIAILLENGSYVE